MFRVILETIPVVVFSYTAQVLFKSGINTIGELDGSLLFASPIKFFSQFLLNWQIMFGFLIAAIGALFYIFSLSKNDFTIVFPVLGALGFIILPFVGKFLLGETITPGRIIGTLIIVVGMIIVTRG